MGPAAVPRPHLALCRCPAQKWRFDLHGYLVLRGCALPRPRPLCRRSHPPALAGLSQALVGALLRDLDTWLEAEEEPPPPLNRHNQDGTTKAHVGNPHYGSEAYQELNLCAPSPPSPLCLTCHPLTTPRGWQAPRDSARGVGHADGLPAADALRRDAHGQDARHGAPRLPS